VAAKLVGGGRGRKRGYLLLSLMRGEKKTPSWRKKQKKKPGERLEKMNCAKNVKNCGGGVSRDPSKSQVLGETQKEVLSRRKNRSFNIDKKGSVPA